MDCLWAVKQFVAWEEFEPNFYHPLLGGVKGPDGCIGCMLVFDDYQKALAYVEYEPSRLQAVTRPKALQAVHPQEEKAG